MRRFFVPLSSLHGDEAIIEGSDAHHLLHVLRKKKGDCFEATDGQSRALLLKIDRIEKDRAICRIVEVSHYEERRVVLRLFQALPKNSAWEDILLRACELGVTEIIPFLSERSVYPSRVIGTKKDRWERILEETTKKVGRTSQPLLSPIIDWRGVFGLLQSKSLRIMPWENEKTVSLRTVLEQHASSEVIEVMIGPEGGFSLREIEEARQWGFLTVSLGSRILTTSTAAISTIAYIYFSLEGREKEHPQKF